MKNSPHGRSPTQPPPAATHASTPRNRRRCPDRGKWRLPTRHWPRLICLALLCGEAVYAIDSDRSPETEATAPVTPAPTVRRLHYELQLTNTEIRVKAALQIQSTHRAGAVLPVLEGDLAVLPGELPSGITLQRGSDGFSLFVAKAGVFDVNLQFVVRPVRQEPWAEARFRGPLAGIGLVDATADALTEVELLSGTPREPNPGDPPGQVAGVLGAEREVAVRWRSRAAAGSHQTVVTCDTTATVSAAPAVLQVVTELRYQVLQGQVQHLEILMPVRQALTRVEGEHLRDWQLAPASEGTGSVLRVDFVRPVEGSYPLRLHTEQTLDGLPIEVSMAVPEPQGVDRETGLLVVQAQDITLDATPTAGLRQVNAPNGAQAAYRFHSRPAALDLRLDALDPVISLEDRLQVRLEDHRLLQDHELTLGVERAGLYTLELGPLQQSVVTEVRAEGLDEWTVREDRLHLNFGSRILGERPLFVRLEQPFTNLAGVIVLQPLLAPRAQQQSTELGIVVAPGLQVKTTGIDGLREIPVRQRAGPGDAALAFASLQANWTLQVAAERLAPRVVAEVFNLVTLGDGIVGGSATVRYAILNQGAQEFRLQVPATWRNVDFTGHNIRRKDRDGDIWIIGLQDKVWGAYTLVVTYDQPFDPHQATLRFGGLHALDVEREAGSLAVTSTGGLQLQETQVAGPLERIDEAELAVADRALVTRTALLAYRYTDTSTPYALEVEVRRFEAASILAAVADRTQLTTVLTEDGQMLTQAGFMVKNHDKQFQRFDLPPEAKLWSIFVNNEPVKAEQEDAKILVPLPRGLDRDQVFSVELVYAQQIGSLRRLQPRDLALVAPNTDVQTTYAEWELFLPPRCLLRGFGGTMSAAPGTTYGLLDAWTELTTTYTDLIQHHIGFLLGLGFLVLLAVLVTMAIRNGLQGVIGVGVVLCILVILAGMLLPGLAKAKAKAQRIAAVNNLKQIGLATRIYATDNREELPASFEDMMPDLATEKVTIDPDSGRRFIYLGGALPTNPPPNAVLAYSPEAGRGWRAVLLADGSVQQLNEERFHALLQETVLMLSGRQHAQTQAGAASATPGARLDPTPTPTAPNTAVAALPLAEGLRPIRIDLPRSGQRLVFTKVLNVRREPLSVEAWSVRTSVWMTARGSIEAAAFLAGLAWLWRQWRRPRPASLTVSLALLLVLGSVADLLLQLRWLGMVLTLLIPFAVLSLLVYLFRRHGARWLRHNASHEVAAATGEVTSAGAATTLLLAALLLASSGRAASPTMPAAEISQATYSASVGDQVARLEAVLTVRARESGTQLRLFNNDVAVEAFSADGAGVRLLRGPDHLAVLLPRRGEFQVRVHGVVRITGASPKRLLAFDIPPALVSRVIAVVNETDATVVLPAAVSCAARAEGNQTRVEALLGASNRVELSWTPKVKSAADMAATVFCSNLTRISVGSGVLHCRTELDYQLAQGELGAVRVQLPAGHRLLKVESELVRTWHLREPANPGEPSLLDVQLVRRVSPSFRLTIETERSLDDLPASVDVTIPQAAGVKRETGWIGLHAAEELGLSVTTQAGLQKADAVEFAKLFSVL